MASLDDAEIIWRRVPRVHRNPDDSAMSSGFKTQELCVHRASKTTLQAVITAYPDDHVYEFTVAQAKAAGCTDVDDTLQPGEPPDHAVVLGTTTGKVARRLKAAAKRVHPP